MIILSIFFRTRFMLLSVVVVVDNVFGDVDGLTSKSLGEEDGVRFGT